MNGENNSSYSFKEADFAVSKMRLTIYERSHTIEKFSVTFCMQIFHWPVLVRSKTEKYTRVEKWNFDDPDGCIFLLFWPRNLFKIKK